MAVLFEDISTGYELEPVRKPPITRTTLALFGGASGDHNPIHIDIDFAKSAGMPDVFAHGMLSMAYLGQVLTNWVPQEAIITFGVRFQSITHLNDEITCSGRVIEKTEQDGKNRVRIEMQAVNQHGDIKLKGEAIVAL